MQAHSDSEIRKSQVHLHQNDKRMHTKTMNSDTSVNELHMNQQQHSTPIIICNEGGGTPLHSTQATESHCILTRGTTPKKQPGVCCTLPTGHLQCSADHSTGRRFASRTVPTSWAQEASHRSMHHLCSVVSFQVALSSRHTILFLST